MLIDTHCHLHDPQWFTPEQQTDFLKNAKDRGVEKIICIGTNPQDSKNAHDSASECEDVYWTYGIHPEFANPTTLAYDETMIFFERIKRAKAERAEGGTREDGLTTGSQEKNHSLLYSSLVAIGEIGLDYHYDGYNRSAQIKLLEQMLQLSLDLDLPVSLHIREAFTDAFAVLDNFPQVRGVVHSFTGSKRDLRQALERGFFIGVNGLVTYTTPPLPPLERIVLETDAPFLTPVPFRGKINQPGYVADIAVDLSNKLGVTVQEVEEQTTNNAREIFKI